jgi:site-specific DNA-methyltransferase (adenine-specific)
MNPVVIGNASLYLGDCLEVMRTLPACSVDSIVTDPPYELGFMCKQWDSSGIAYDVAMWKEALRVLKPGGHLLAFSGSRTYHRMACSIEDAGFDVRDNIARFYSGDEDKDAFLRSLSEEQIELFLSIFGEPSMLEWVYGSGFPKSHNLDGEHEGWGTALKPAHEPICVARKPLSGTVAANVQKFGTGAININACRIESEPMRPNTGKGALPRRNESEVREAVAPSQPHELGRWPANVIHDGSEKVLDNFPEAMGAKGQVTGNEPTASGFSGVVSFGGMIKRTASLPPRIELNKSAARFFYCSKTSKEDRNEGLYGFELKEGGIKNESGRGFSKTDPNKTILQLNNHPTVKPTELMQYLTRLVTPKNGLVLDPFMGSGSTGKSCWLEGFKFIGIEKDPAYFEIAKVRVKSVPAQDRMFI